MPNPAAKRNSEAIFSIPIADDGDFAEGLRLTVASTGKAALAGATDAGIGVNIQHVKGASVSGGGQAAGYGAASVQNLGIGIHAVKLASGSANVVAGDVLYAAANGEVSASGSLAVGICKVPATAGSRVEMVFSVATINTAPITLTATATLTVATHANFRTLILGEVGGDAAATFTLPAATGSGARFRFRVGVINSSNYVIKVANATDVFAGQILTASTSDTPDLGQPWVAGDNDDTITLNATTTGGLKRGDIIEIEDILAGVFAVSGLTQSSGTEATPFSSTVS